MLIMLLLAEFRILVASSVLLNQYTFWHVMANHVFVSIFAISNQHIVIVC